MRTALLPRGKPPVKLPVGCQWPSVMLEDGILIEQSLTRQPKKSRDWQHSTQVLTGLDGGQRSQIRSISWSCQSSFGFLQKSELEGDGCRVNHAEERPILLSLPG